MGRQRCSRRAGCLIEQSVRVVPVSPHILAEGGGIRQTDGHQLQAGLKSSLNAPGGAVIAAVRMKLRQLIQLGLHSRLHLKQLPGELFIIQSRGCIQPKIQVAIHPLPHGRGDGLSFRG